MPYRVSIINQDERKSKRGIVLADADVDAYLTSLCCPTCDKPLFGEGECRDKHTIVAVSRSDLAPNTTL